MGKPYSLDFRKRVVAAIENGGLSRNQAAKRFGIGISTAIGWMKRLRETGSMAPGQMGGHKPKAISGEYRLWLLQRIKERYFTLRELVAELAERGLKVDYRSVWEFVHAEKLSFKKSVAAGERDRPDVARRRAQWTKCQDRIEPERLVFIDETWTRTDMAALRGWAPRGRHRLICSFEPFAALARPRQRVQTCALARAGERQQCRGMVSKRAW
jgi:transposase